MKNILGSFIIACSMYSKIPMPQIAWTRERMRYVMCFFPLVGAAQALLLYGFARIAWGLELWMFYYVGGTVLPILVNGGIHMDGLLDVLDARASYGDREKKLEILKDPHAGAFAIIGCGVYLMLYLALFAELPAAYVPALGVVYILTRALSGLSVVWFPKAKSSGLAASFSDGAQKRTVVISMVFYLLAAFGFLFWNYGILTGFACMAAVCLIYGHYYRMSQKEFGGITGDLAGYFLQLCELGLLLALVLASKV